MGCTCHQKLPGHRTPTSSLCWQVWIPIPRFVQLRSEDSVPLHPTRSRKIPPLPLPKTALLWTVAPVGSSKFYMLTSYTSVYTWTLVCVNLPIVGYPNCLHTTLASGLVKELSQTVPHWLLKQISTLPSPSLRPPTKRTEPLVQLLSVTGTVGPRECNVVVIWNPCFSETHASQYFQAQIQ